MSDEYAPPERTEYQFAVWPLEGSWERSVYDLFRQYGRVSMSFTDDEWLLFQASMEHQGFTLREVEKMTPCVSCGREVDVSGPHAATRTGLRHHPGCPDA